MRNPANLSSMQIIVPYQQTRHFRLSILSFENKLIAYLTTLGAIQMTAQCAQEISQFSGNENYYRIMPNVLMTDGAKFVADNGCGYWLITDVAAHCAELTEKETFIVATLHVTRTATSSHAILKLDDGNDNILATQFIEYTDFPLDEIILYACYNADMWVIMIPREY
jgi:hypothetical protein